MAKRFAAFSFAAIALFGAGAVAAQALAIPTPDEAKAAVISMFGDPDLARLLRTGHVVIGTCKKPVEAGHDGAVACAINVVMGAGSSETQVNFYRAGGKWVATPTEEDLPFPDPKLMK